MKYHSVGIVVGALTAVALVGMFVFFALRPATIHYVSPEPSPEPSEVISEASSVLKDTHAGWEECTRLREEEMKVLKECSKSLGECTELLESVEERYSTAAKEEAMYTKQMMLSLKRCEEGK